MCVYTKLVNDYDIFSHAGEQPSMLDIIRLRIPQKVGANYFPFGIILLNDRTGSLVNAIEHDCNRQSGPIVQKILQEWLEGKGVPVTWDSLVKTLRDIDLSSLADQIQASKIPDEERRGGGEHRS